MKRFILMMALFVGLIHASANNQLLVPSVTIPQGGSATIEIALENTDLFTSFQMTLTLPEGVSLVSCKGSSRLVEHTLGSTPVDERCTLLTCYPKNLTQPTNIGGNSGALFELALSVDASLTVGTMLEAKLDEVKFSDFDELPIPLDGVTINLTIGEPADTRMQLDENSTTAPEASTGVNVRVRRTIKANQWSTICLPFAMTEAQMKTAFGNDVELGDFTGIETTYEDNNESVLSSIKVKFSSSKAIEDNHPYIIKVSSPVTEFTVDNVDIIVEEIPSVDRDEYSYQVQVGKNKFETRYMYNSFIGIYTSGTKVPELCLFLNGNQFWYSTGQTNIKGFRAYFDFYEWLTDAENAKTRIHMDFDDSMITGINSIDKENLDCYYDLQGRKVEKPIKGMYVTKGKKVIIK
jgi:hypothetical protein